MLQGSPKYTNSPNLCPSSRLLVVASTLRILMTERLISNFRIRRARCMRVVHNKNIPTFWESHGIHIPIQLRRRSIQQLAYHMVHLLRQSAASRIASSGRAAVEVEIVIYISQQSPQSLPRSISPFVKRSLKMKK